ncbi:alpha/beta hydrolase [Lactovum miscens]|uniref:Putative tributyrin esterase n=1 Tax=Lactovum miscens TaxID=190387 RepID=A0A841CAI8_9LACT|nr:alpha/beta hydrolase family protein [Lactovum miscens]MBB5888582.1 putative tributyrin esterase [Lactovum miscens]
MAILKIEYYSEVLGMNRPVNVIYPEAAKTGVKDAKDIPVIYLLHGMSGNENAWLNRSGIDRLVRKTNVALVMPSTDLGWYSNTKYGMNYFDAIAQELPRVIHNFFPSLSTKREKNFIVGLSMGGYGAFKLALLTDKFSCAASLSGALSFDFQEDLIFEENENYWSGIFGSKTEFDLSETNNLQNLARNSKERPKLYAWCGAQDFLFEVNNVVTKELKNLGYDITYEISEGIHDWYYWTQKIDRILDWLPIDYQREERKI